MDFSWAERPGKILILNIKNATSFEIASRIFKSLD